MMTIDFKIGNARRRSFDEGEIRTTKHHTWVAVAVGGSAVLGAGASLYGANKQAKSVKEAANINDARQAEQNAAAWANYLMTRGVNPTGAQTGQLPTNPQAINARLPLWATANFAKPGAQSRWVRKGSGLPIANTLSRTSAPAYAPSGGSTALDMSSSSPLPLDSGMGAIMYPRQLTS